MSNFADDFRDFVFDMARAQARAYGAMIPDSPQRTAPPEMEPAPKAFESLDIREQLDAAGTICRRQVYREAAEEALPESEAYPAWVRKLLDSSADPAELVLEARRIVLAHLQASAQRREEDLSGFV